jgi:two-component system cell cycle sensor histidine kinase/response regulator CckA
MSDRENHTVDSENTAAPGAQAGSPSRMTAKTDELELTLQFFRLVNASETLRGLSEAAIQFFQAQSECEAVAIRLRTGSEFPYLSSAGFPEEFLRCENNRPVGECFGEKVRDASGAAKLECRCEEVLAGCGHPSLPHFTEQGSFWTNAVSEERHGSLPIIPGKGCNGFGYESVALIVLKAGKDRIGLLQLNDRRKQRFTHEKILLWERLASYLAVALARFHAEETLRSSEQRLAQAVNIACLGIFVMDHATQQCHHSPEFCAIHGLDPKLAHTKDEVLALVVDEDRPALVDALERSFDPAGDGLLQSEHRIIRHDGIRWLQMRAQTFFEGEGGGRHPVRTVGAVIDITARKQSELDLTASRQQLRTALEAAKLGVWCHDLGTGMVTGDASTLAIFGLPEGSALPAKTIDGYFHPEDLPRLRSDRAQLESCHLSINAEYRIHTAIGAQRWIALWGNQLRDRTGKPLVLTGLIQDITERKEADQRIKRLEEQFRHAQKMEAVGRLAGNIAHDFNNLLMVIRSYVEILEETLAGQNEPLRCLQAVSKAADRAAGLTGQLLAFSRKQVLSPVPLNLNDSVAESALLLRGLMGEQVELVLELEPSPWTVRADPDQIAQVLMNLSLNSRDAMPEGGKLTLATKNVRVGPAEIERNPFLQRGDYVVLSVSDTGTGILPEVQERMFEPFFTTKSMGKGTGLGLSMVYGIVKQSNGYLLCDSRPGEGATFHIYLPRVNAPQPTEEKSRSEVPLHGIETILLVEDEEALRESIGRFLSGLGYKVLEASSGPQALTFAGQDQNPIHVMISDVLMPGMSGRELSQKLVELRPEIKTIFMSGYIDDPTVRDGVTSEGVAFLQKPFRLMTLAEKLRAMLD